MRRIVTSLGMAVLALALLFPAARAFATINIPGSSGDNCTVRERRWSNHLTADGLPLPMAMALANATDPNWDRWCRKKVTIDVTANRLQMLTPLEVIGGGSVDAPFVLEGKAGFELDARSLEGKGYPCAVVVGKENGNRGYIQLDKISITGVPADMSAICINDTDVTIKDVTVDSGLNGIVFEPGVRGGRIEAAAFIKNTVDSGYAIDFGQTAGESFFENALIPMDGALGATGNDGIIAPAGETITVQSNLIDHMFKVDSPVQVCLMKADEKKSGTYNGMIEVKGFVVDTSDGSPLAEAPLAEDVVRLQIYSGDGFEGFVGPAITVQGLRVGMFGTTMTATGQTTGKTGQFRFYMTKNTSDLSRIIVVPETADHKIGTPSKAIRLSGDDTGECQNRSFQAGGGGGGDNSDRLRVVSVQDCKNKRGIAGYEDRTGDPLDGYDTDGDNLYDDEEDLDRDCKCETELGETCWYKKDTDYDGTPDGVGEEQPCKAVLDAFAGGSDPAAALTNGKCPTSDEYDPDGDGKPNALDDDSDGDGLADRVEARNQAIVFTAGDESAQGLLYEFQNEAADPIMINGEVVTCPLGQGFTAGVSYPWYWVTRENGVPVEAQRVGESIPTTGVPAEGEEATPQDGDKVLDVMVCRIESLAWPSNFDGVYNDDNNEANPYRDIAGPPLVKAVDTDGDGFCDGGGSKCAGLTLNDQCPTLAGSGTTDGCPSAVPCNSNMFKWPWYTTSPRYVQRDAAGAPIGLRKTADNKIAVYEENRDATGKYNYIAIATACGDTDKDGIPDCVENPYGGCDDPQTHLSFLNKDSDGDGYIDGKGVGNASAQNEDVCPGDPGPGIDGFVDSANHAYSCGNREQARLVYQLRPVLSCFFDRDHDGLRDCEEDVNMDGAFLKQQNFAGIAGIDDAMMATLETDTLDPDSDDDTLTDKEERQNVVKTLADGRNIHTNPMAKDTDGDTINDNAEDRDGDHMFVITPVQGTEGCTGFQFLDTDPTSDDTDGDGLKDNIELDGDLYIGDVFVNMILDQSVWGQGGGINLVSNPRTADSDGDQVPDNEEYDGVVGYSESNPCMQDSDGDSIADAAEIDGCALNKDPNCDGTATMGIDQDSDGLPDGNEAKLGTDPKNPDTDGDGVKDGTEDANHNGIYEPNLGETNPLVADTDGDGLSDGMELRYGTDGATADTDGDCILDGLEDANRNGKYEASETNALDADTDEDGLPDGLIRGIGEDLNCNGVRDVDAGGGFTETDPVNPDSDFDGNSDYDEMMDGGWNPAANISKATRERGGGCSMVGSAAPSSMISLLGMLIAATGVLIGKRRQERKTPCL